MLGCPLATASETLWLTANQDRYWQRSCVAFGLSLGLHVAAIAGISLYLFFSKPVMTFELSSSTPNLPMRVELITQQSQAARVVENIKMATPAAVQTTAPSEQKVRQKLVEESKPKPVIKEQAPKKSIAKNNAGTAAANSNAGAPVVSETSGMQQSVNVASKPRYRVPPQLPEYPAQAQRRRQEGVTIVLITVEANGRTSNVSIQKTSGFSLLDNAAVKAAKKWQIMPHEINGRAIRATFTVPVDFYLK